MAVEGGLAGERCHSGARKIGYERCCPAWLRVLAPRKTDESPQFLEGNIQLVLMDSECNAKPNPSQPLTTASLEGSRLA